MPMVSAISEGLKALLTNMVSTTPLEGSITATGGNNKGYFRSCEVKFKKLHGQTWRIRTK